MTTEPTEQERQRSSDVFIEAMGNKQLLAAMEQQAKNIEAQKTLALIEQKTLEMRLELAQLMAVNPDLSDQMGAEPSFNAESQQYSPVQQEPSVEGDFLDEQNEDNFSVDKEYRADLEKKYEEYSLNKDTFSVDEKVPFEDDRTIDVIRRADIEKKYGGNNLSNSYQEGESATV